MLKMQCLKCGNNITDTCELGVNDSDFYVCDKCKLGFNVIISKLDDDLEVLK